MDLLGDDFFGEGFDKFFRKLNGKERKSIIDNLKNFESYDPTKDDLAKMKELGEPDKIEEVEVDGVKMIKKSWNRDGVEQVYYESVSEGNMFMSIKSTKFTYSNPFNVIPLEKQLESAIETENFERAAEIRDLIAQRKKENELFSDKKDAKI